MYKERRKYIRLKLDKTCYIFGQCTSRHPLNSAGFFYEGIVKDISEKGISFETELVNIRYIQTGDKVEIFFSDDYMGYLAPEQIVVTAEIVRKSENAEKKTVVYGAKLLTINNKSYISSKTMYEYINGSSEYVSHAIAQIKNKAEQAIIDSDLNTFSSIGACHKPGVLGHIPLYKEYYSTQKLFDDIKKITAAKIGNKKLEFIMAVYDDYPQFLYGDRQKLWQIISTLVSCAVKYTEQGRILLKAGCTLTNSEYVLSFSIVDTGRGIKKEEKQKLLRIFDGFEKGKINETESSLDTVKQYVELLNGSLSFESDFGNGTVFSFCVSQGLGYKPDENKKDNEPNSLLIDIPQGIIRCKGRDNYIEALDTFSRSVDEKEKAIRQVLDSGKIRDFTLEVQTVKNTVYSIGASDISDKFSMLEKAGNVEDLKYITACIQSALTCLNELKDESVRISQLFSKQELDLAN